MCLQVVQVQFKAASGEICSAITVVLQMGLVGRWCPKNTAIHGTVQYHSNVLGCKHDMHPSMGLVLFTQLYMHHHLKCVHEGWDVALKMLNPKELFIVVRICCEDACSYLMKIFFVDKCPVTREISEHKQIIIIYGL